MTVFGRAAGSRGLQGSRERRLMIKHNSSCPNMPTVLPNDARLIQEAGGRLTRLYQPPDAPGSPRTK